MQARSDVSLLKNNDTVLCLGGRSVVAENALQVQMQHDRADSQATFEDFSDNRVLSSKTQATEMSGSLKNVDSASGFNSDGTVKVDQFFKTKLCIPFTKGQCRRELQCWYVYSQW